MKELNWFERLVDWVLDKWYDCKKGRHLWVYKLSKSGIVYLDDKEVPLDLWECTNCGVKKQDKI